MKTFSTFPSPTSPFFSLLCFPLLFLLFFHSLLGYVSSLLFYCRAVLSLPCFVHFSALELLFSLSFASLFPFLFHSFFIWFVPLVVTRFSPLPAALSGQSSSSSLFVYFFLFSSFFFFFFFFITNGITGDSEIFARTICSVRTRSRNVSALIKGTAFAAGRLTRFANTSLFFFLFLLF